MMSPKPAAEAQHEDIIIAAIHEGTKVHEGTNAHAAERDGSSIAEFL